MPLVTDATPALNQLDHLLRVPFAEVRTATDLKDPWPHFIAELARASASKSTSPTAAGQSTVTKEAGTSQEAPPLAKMNPWLVDAIATIDAHRKSVLGNQAQASGLSLLDSAEMLAPFMTEVSSRRRPRLNIEPDGRPTFATATDDFYIHLTVDEPNRLTWFAVVAGTEYFDEGVVFDGRRLPPALSQLFTL
jgi:hypothetical protein